jgi:hypothetical protein
MCEYIPCSDLSHVPTRFNIELKAKILLLILFDKENGLRIQTINYAAVLTEVLSHLWILKSCCLCHVGFLLVLLFYPEHGGEMFLRNIGSFSTDNTALNRKHSACKINLFIVHEPEGIWKKAIVS